MQIIAHRGYWLERAERNSPAAFRRAFDSGFGVETDIRDGCGGLVISHDPASAGAMTMADFFELYCKRGPDLPLALNIKADGLQGSLQEMLVSYGVQRYFVFDMSLPDMLGYRERGLRYYTRQSEYETAPLLYGEAAGVWVDCFKRDWIAGEIIQGHLDRQKCLCFVSPELHGRDHLPLWERLREAGQPAVGGRLMLCTDYPEKARLFFHGSN